MKQTVTTLIVSSAAASDLLNLVALKGLWQGFNRGLYKSSKNFPAECLSADIIKRFKNTVSSDQDRDFYDYWTVFNDVSHIVANLTDCGFDQTFRDLTEFCDDTHMYHTYAQNNPEGKKGNLCDIGTISGNLK